MTKIATPLLIGLGAVVVVSSAAVIWFAAKHPGPAAAALVIAWLTPGIPPPGPFGAAGPRVGG